MSLGPQLAVLLAVAALGEKAPARFAQELTSAIGEDGLSPPLRFAVPEGTRSFTVVVVGPEDAELSLGSFRAGGREWVDGAGPPGDAPAQRAPRSAQAPRAGTFTFIYPYAPHQPAPSGVIELRVAAGRACGGVRVMGISAPDDGARVLHLNLFSVTAGENAEPLESRWQAAVVGEAQALLGQAGIRLQVDSVLTLPGTPFSTIQSAPEPWETPHTELARLALLGGRLVDNGALNVFVVDRLPAGIDGVSLGAPGPPVPSSYYFGVALRRQEATAAGWVLAHELAHFLGLRHVREISPAGVEVLDPIDDTEPGRGNLMERGRELTPGQREVLLRSPLLGGGESNQ